MIKKIAFACLVGFSVLHQTQAHQLAITEVMTAENGKNFPDWWELTNFGTNDVDLTGFSWNDDSHGGFSGADTASFTGYTVHAGESVVVTEPNAKGGIIDAPSFRAWWGISNSVQVIVLNVNDPGLGASGDAVRLWSTNLVGLGANTNGLDLDQNPAYLVDRVDTTAAATGVSLVYDPTNGTFGISSSTNSGAFVSATDGDIGSPGVASTNPAPIVIATQPTNVLVNVGSPAVFTVAAFGLPKPRFAWLFNGQPVDTNVVTVGFAVISNYCVGTLTVTNTQTTNAGTFRAVASNGFEPSVTSSNATLTVNTGPLIPFFTQAPPTNLSCYVGQPLSFAVTAFGNPPPTFSWQFGSNVISGQTDSEYSFTPTDTNQSGVYTVFVTNSAGGTNASVALTVTTKPNLRITEVESSEATNAAGKTLGHGDWWELSNLGTFPVNIQGYRFDDDSFSLGDALTITNDVTIAPGESIVLCDTMTPDDFRTWWGANQLPPNLQIVEYSGSGIGLSATGDALTVWNAAATIETDFIDSISISTAVVGTTFGFDPVEDTFLGFAPDGLSVLGVNGGIAAAVNGDIGSPGTLINLPRFTSIVLTNGGAQLTWPSQPNYQYTVQAKTNLTDALWTTLTNLGASGNILNFTDSATNSMQFYRLIMNP